MATNMGRHPPYQKVPIDYLGDYKVRPSAVACKRVANLVVDVSPQEEFTMTI